MTDSMRVTLGGMDQAGYPNNQYCAVSFSAVAEDTAGLWHASQKSVVAPAAGVMVFDWQVWIDAGASQYGDGRNGQFVAKLIKNCTINSDGTPNYGSTGADIFASIGSPGCQPGTAATGGGVSDRATCGDIYTLFLWATASSDSGSCTVNGNIAHTQFSAMFVAD